MTLSSSTPETCFDIDLDRDSLPYLADHAVRDALVLPAAVYLETAFATSSEALGSVAQRIADVTFHHACLLSEDAACQIELTIQQTGPGAAAFTITSPAIDGPPGDDTRQLYVTGRLETTPPPEPGQVALEQVRGRCRTAISGAAHYTAMQRRGLQYGPLFQAVESIVRREGETLGSLALPAPLLADAEIYYMHPVLLDAGLQCIAVARAPEDDFFLPVGLRALVWHHPLPARLLCHVSVISGAEAGAEACEADIRFCDESGRVATSIHGLTLKRMPSAREPIAVPELVEITAANLSAQPAQAAEPNLAADPSDYAARLADIWADVLQFSRVDIHDSFFELGGDSLMANQIATRATRMGLRITAQQILEHVSIAQILASLNPVQE